MAKKRTNTVRKLTATVAVEVRESDSVANLKTQIASGTDSDGNRFIVTAAFNGHWLAIERAGIPCRLVRLNDLVRGILEAE